MHYTIHYTFHYTFGDTLALFHSVTPKCEPKMSQGEEATRTIPEEVRRHFSVIKEIEEQTDRGAAIIGVAYLEQRLEEGIKTCFLSGLEVGDLFRPSQGPLGTFGGKIDIAHALGLLGPRTRRDLHLIRRIRNDFAHVFDPLTFESEHIKNRCDELWLPVNVLWSGTEPPKQPREKFLDAVMLIFNLLHTEITQVERGAKKPYVLD